MRCLTGQRTTVKAGSAAVSLDVPSVAVGFALALFLWGVLVGLGSMFRSAFRRAPAPQRWAIGRAVRCGGSAMSYAKGAVRLKQN